VKILNDQNRTLLVNSQSAKYFVLPFCFTARRHCLRLSFAMGL
jgi:hypothetical protein